MSRLTKLEAVNLILAAGGEYPVNTIDGPTSVNATVALRLLEAAQREVLAVGWHWNVEEEVTFEVDLATGKIPVGSSTLRFQAEDAPWITQRGDFLYDRANHTDVFEEAVMGSVIKYLVWDELPEEAKNYALGLAKVRYYSSYKGTDATLEILQRDAFIARAALEEQDADTGNYSIFDNPDVAAGVRRGNQYVGRATYGGYGNSTNRTPR
jgi:hypothetical protein